MPRFILTPVALLLSIQFAVCLSAQTLEQVPASEQTPRPKLKTLNDHFPFLVPETVDAWNERADGLRRRVLVATGLWPMPEKTPIKPVIHGKISRDGFTVEKVYFESLPGHFVTGMLFRPAPENQLGLVDGKRPGVLCPHGHGGRTMRLDDSELARQIATGGEVFEASGRYPKLARCAHLARMGCVSFIFDMLGYADSQQIDYQIAHRHAAARPEEADRENPCFFGIDADLNLQSIMGLQTWNAVRSLDFLAELADVDPDRLGVTGGSGGGTQTILLGAIDPRIKVGFPNGMVSTSMQGGCYCENCNYLRIGTGNVELAALFAPKPQGMTAANDWTKAMLEDGFPQLQQLYGMLGVKQNVMCGDVLRFPHNYNYVSRSMMYPWMARHLGLPAEAPLVESDFEPFTEAEMSVWNEQHPAPTEIGIEHERNVLAWWKQQSDQRLNELVPTPGRDPVATQSQLDSYRRVVGGAWSVIFDRTMPAVNDLLITHLNKDAVGDDVARYRVQHPGWDTVVEFDVQLSDQEDVPGHVVMSSVAGQSSADLETQFKSYAQHAVVGKPVVVHLLPAIENNDRAIPAEFRQPLIADERSYSAFTFGYNRPLAVKRFEQLLCVLAFLGHEEPDGPRFLVANPADWVSTAAAAVVAGEAIEKLLFVGDGFQFSSVANYADQNFVPGSAKYFDLAGLLSLRAPHALTLVGGGEAKIGLVEQVYAAAGASAQLERK